MEVRCNSLEELASFGTRLAGILKPGDVVLLAGDLGAGKTTLVSEICRAWGFNEVSSPTFTLIQTYECEPRVFHLDLYRLDSERELMLLDLDRVFDQENAVFFIEWAEKLGSLMPNEYVAISIAILDGEKRQLQFEAKGSGAEQRLKEIDSAFT